MATFRQIKYLKIGQHFRLTDSKSADVWVRGRYLRDWNGCICHKFDDVHCYDLFKATQVVSVVSDF